MRFNTAENGQRDRKPRCAHPQPPALHCTGPCTGLKDASTPGTPLAATLVPMTGLAPGIDRSDLERRAGSAPEVFVSGGG